MGTKRGRDHVSEDDLTNGQLERNDSYKQDSYGRMSGLAHLRNSGSVVAALTDREKAVAKRKNMSVSEYRDSYTSGKSPTSRVPMYLIGYTDPESGLRNFGHKSTSMGVIAARAAARAALKQAAKLAGKRKPTIKALAKAADAAKKTYLLSNPAPQFESKLPYPHNAHHIIPVATFHVSSWGETVSESLAAYRQFLASSEYDINKPENLIYLPQPYGDTWICDLHGLPDHSSKHNIYNEKVATKCDELYDLIEEGVDEEDCEERDNFLTRVYNKAIEIQTQLDTALQASGSVAIGDAI